MNKERLEDLARELAARESGRSGQREQARKLAEHLRATILDGVECFGRTLKKEGASYLDLVEVGPVEPDDKSIRAFQIRIRRGRFRALVISKDRGEVMLVGPFRKGRTQEPCHAIHLDGKGESTTLLEAPIEDLLVSLIRESYRK